MRPVSLAAQIDDVAGDPASTRPILGVSSSILERPWWLRLNAEGEMRAMALAQAHGLPDLLARVLAARQVEIGEVDAFLTPKLKDLLPDPSTVVAVDVAVARLADAVTRREHVA